MTLKLQERKGREGIRRYKQLILEEADRIKSMRGVGMRAHGIKLCAAVMADLAERYESGYLTTTEFVRLRFIVSNAEPLNEARTPNSFGPALS